MPNGPEAQPLGADTADGDADQGSSQGSNQGSSQGSNQGSSQGSNQGSSQGSNQAPSRDAQRHEENDRLRQAELIISYVLRGGVLLAAGIISLGVVLFYAKYLRSGGQTGPLVYPKTASAVFAGLVHGDPVAVIALGLLVLLLTPVLRVLVSVVTFALERDRLYTAITLLVFFILLVSFLLGRGGS